MKLMYNVCLTIIVVVMTICISYAAIYFNSAITLFFLAIPTFISECLIYKDDREEDKNG